MNNGRIGLVIAADLDQNQLTDDVLILKRGQVAAVLTTLDGEELSWFAQDELEFQLADWEQ